MSAAAKGDTVSIHYTGRLPDGTIFDSSSGDQPLEFTIGTGMVIPGFEQGAAGMEIGEKKTIEILPADAYGDYSEDYLREVPRGEINIGAEPSVGMELELRGPNGESISITIVDVTDETITL